MRTRSNNVQLITYFVKHTQKYPQTGLSAYYDITKQKKRKLQ